MEGLIFGILRYLIINCVPQLVWGFSQAIWLPHINKVVYLSACLSVCLSIYLKKVNLANADSSLSTVCIVTKPFHFEGKKNLS